MSAREVLADHLCEPQDRRARRNGQPCGDCYDSADKIISALSAAGFAIVPREGLANAMYKACGQAMACAHPEAYQGDKTDAQIEAAIIAEHDVALEISQKHVALLLSAAKETT